MSQNLVSLDLGAADVLAIDAALDTLEKLFAGFVELTPEQRHKLTKMGDRSEAFCRQTLMVLAQNKQMIPPGFDLDEAQSDLLTFDTLRPRIQRLRGKAEGLFRRQRQRAAKRSPDADARLAARSGAKRPEAAADGRLAGHTR